WTNSQSIPRNTNVYVYHNLSVNVKDDAIVAIRIQVFRNDGAEVDVSTQPGQKAYTTTVGLRDSDWYNVLTYGDETIHATLRFDLKVVRVGKANTILVVPNDWSTLSNGTIAGVP